IRKIFERAGGKLGAAHCVAYLFERKGLVSVDATTTDEDSLMAIVLDAGADDLKRAGSAFEITCDPAAFNAVKAAVEKANVPILHAEIAQLAKAPMDVDVETGQKVMRLMEALDDHDDVQHVHTAAQITEAMVAEAGK